jgi:endonuclease/exonuclease/phosphatase family metal-dependent hydrolase
MPMSRAIARTPVLILLALLAGCAQAPRDDGGDPAAPERPLPAGGARVRILVYEIHHCEGLDGELDLARTARIVSGARADIAVLLGVDRRTDRSGGVDQAATIASELGFEHAFAEAVSLEGGSHGVAVLARTAFAAPRRIPLAALPLEEERVAVEVALTPWGDGPAIRCIGTELAHESAETRLAQVAALKSSLEGDPVPAILAGTFHFTPGSGPYRLLTEGWVDAAAAVGSDASTWPAGAPQYRIDYVFLRPAERWKVISAEVLDEPVASDHRPLVVEVELLPPSPPLVAPGS